MTINEPRALFRISNHITLDGNGGKKAGGRWHSMGNRIVYLSDSPMAAIVETLVHLDIDGEDTPDFYTLLKVSVPDSVAVQSLDPPAGTEWKQNLKLTRSIGDAWLASVKTSLARVPSAIAPHTWNYLLNPDHPDAKQVQIAEVIKERFDNRFFRLGTR
ncbi:MAG TPA: RES family NAD+ phosphorylase [Terracidiphilus sp.]|jgi:RES domain-containing protein